MRRLPRNRRLDGVGGGDCLRIGQRLSVLR
jgi:hypothetical protein